MLDNKLNKTATVINELGLHARPAARIAAIANEAQSDVWLYKNGEQADATSIIDILSLACFKGTVVTLEISNPADAPVLNKIIDFFERGFEE
ncbi:MAG: HPr family phosphocarrier protein [Desulfobacteraceae bacterium]|nr:MAG: HPr family phosphocarrier protein [Desulfobacteraceae bacterium]